MPRFFRNIVSKSYPITERKGTTMHCSINRRMNRGLSAWRPRLAMGLLALSVTAFSLLPEAAVAQTTDDITSNKLITTSYGEGDVRIRHLSGPFPPIVVLRNGGIIDGKLALYHGSNLIMDDGEVSGLSSNHQSTVDMKGGTVTGNVTASHSSRLTISGGTVTGNVTAFEHSEVLIRGGIVEGDVYVRDCSTISLYGLDSDATADQLTPVLDQAYKNGLFVRYTLSGKLADGNPVSGFVYIQKNTDCGHNALDVSNSMSMPVSAD
ncbi:MAG TPA: polymer-forming cytoskeletal protein [Candidatus Tectomicrobia bacterium]